MHNLKNVLPKLKESGQLITNFNRKKCLGCQELNKKEANSIYSLFKYSSHLLKEHVHATN